MRNRYIIFKNKSNGTREIFRTVKELYNKYTNERLGITYNSLMNVLAKRKKYENDRFSLTYRQRTKSEWK